MPIGGGQFRRQEEHVLRPRRQAVLNRKDFKLLGQLPTVNGPGMKNQTTYMERIPQVRPKPSGTFTGKQNVDIRVRTSGRVTFPVSVFVVKRGAWSSICAARPAFNRPTMDARFSLDAARSAFRVALRAPEAGKAPRTSSHQPALSTRHVGSRSLDQIPAAHDKMLDNKAPCPATCRPVTARNPALRTVEERAGSDGAD